MNWRSTVRMLDWAVPIGFGIVLWMRAPLRTALEFGGDEGYELMKGFLVSLGHPLYREVWNDQPPLHTELLALLFRIFGPSAYVARLLSVGFAMALVAALYRMVTDHSGRVAGLIALALLVSSSSFVQLCVSVMIELPAMALALTMADPFRCVVWLCVASEIDGGYFPAGASSGICSQANSSRAGD